MNEKVIGLAIVALGAVVLALVKGNLDVKVQVTEDNYKTPNWQIDEILYGRLKSLKERGAQQSFFTVDKYRKAESAYITFLGNQTEENAQRCLRYITECEKNLEFFGI